MNLRLSNGISMAVEFTAKNEKEFLTNKKIALLEYSAKLNTKTSKAKYQLHIQAANGDWIPYNYGSSLTEAGRLRGEWEKCVHAFGGAEKLDAFIGDVGKMIRINKPKLTVIKNE